MITRLLAATLAIVVAAETATAQSRVVVESAPSPEAYAEMLGVDLSSETRQPPAGGLRMRGIRMHTEETVETPTPQPMSGVAASGPRQPSRVSSAGHRPSAAKTAAAPPSRPSPVIVTAPVNFALDSADVPASFELYLDNLAVVLRAPDARGRVLIISGHTDSQGSPDYNQALSERRAAAVARYLFNRGVSRSQLVSFGKGESELIAGRESDHAVNRRVEFRMSN
ncbi:MAG: OmpA family protein [Pseudomonadota bacterium]